MPWAQLRGEPYLDLEVYIDGFESGAFEYLDRLEGLAYLLSEPAWRFLVESAAWAFGDVTAAFKAITFVVSSVYAFAMLRTSRGTVFFLAGPLLIDLAVSQVRSAVAGMLFILAVIAGSGVLWVVLLFVASLIHSAATVLFGLFALSWVLHKFQRTAPQLALIATLAASVILPLAFALAYAGVLDALGDRRVDDVEAWPGGVFVVALSIYYLTLLTSMKQVMSHPVAIFSLLMAGMFVVLALFQVNGLRFISLAYPALIASAFVLPIRQRAVVLVVMLLMCVYHFVLWI